MMQELLEQEPKLIFEPAYRKDLIEFIRINLETMDKLSPQAKHDHKMYADMIANIVIIYLSPKDDHDVELE